MQIYVVCLQIKHCACLILLYYYWTIEVWLFVKGAPQDKKCESYISAGAAKVHTKMGRAGVKDRADVKGRAGVKGIGLV